MGWMCQPIMVIIWFFFIVQIFCSATNSFQWCLHHPTRTTRKPRAPCTTPHTDTDTHWRTTTHHTTTHTLITPTPTPTPHPYTMQCDVSAQRFACQIDKIPKAQLQSGRNLGLSQGCQGFLVTICAAFHGCRPHYWDRSWRVNSCGSL